jgi:hypothetical protein
MPEFQPGAIVLVPTPNFERLTFARVVCSYDGSLYCVRFDDGKLARMTIPEDAAALLSFWLADPPDFRAFVSRQFRIDLEKMRNDEMLTPAQRECLAAEEAKLNAVERLAAEFAGLDQTGPTQY